MMSHVMTAEQLESVDIPGKCTELVRGQLVVREPPGTYHGWIQAKLLIRLGQYVMTNHLGDVFGQDTGFKIASDPDTVRAPDLAFVRREHLSTILRRGYAAVAPDLVAEILSPDDRPGEVLTKVGDWLDAGVKLVWVIDPDRAAAHVHRSDGSLLVIDSHGSLDGEDVVTGFSCPLSDILEASVIPWRA